RVERRQSLGERTALAQKVAETHVARLRAAAGQQKIAEAREADERVRIGAEGRAEAAHFGKAARDECRVRAGTERAPMDNAGGDGEHVFHGATEGDADGVTRPVQA